MKKKIVVKLVSILLCVSILFCVVPNYAYATYYYVSPGGVAAFKVTPYNTRPANYVYSRFEYSFDASNYLTVAYPVPSDMVIKVKYSDIIKHFFTYNKLPDGKYRIGVVMRVREYQYAWVNDPKTRTCKLVSYTKQLGSATIGTANEVTVRGGQPIY